MCECVSANGGASRLPLRACKLVDEDDEGPPPQSRTCPRITIFSTLSTAQKDVQLDAPECLCSKLLYIYKDGWGGCAAEDASCFFLPFQIRLWKPVKNEKNTGEGDMVMVMVMVMVAATCGR